MKLKGKNAVITGGSRGIGFAIAETFAREGAAILLISRNAVELEEAKKRLGGSENIFAVALDMASDQAPQNLRHAIETHFPDGIDILVTAAGIYGPIGRVFELDPKLWKQAIDVNLFGTFAAIQAAAPFMQKRGGGKIITFSGGGEGVYARFSAYVASKGGVVRLTETLAEELREFHIDINAIAPGPVNTKFLEELLTAGPERAGKTTYEKSLAQKTNGGVPPEKVAELVLFLASSESDGISGRVISALHDSYKEFPKHKKEIMESDIYTFKRIKPKDRGLDWK